jgi:CubicO group peptidase (beta-lactamase class C family)
MRDRVPGASIAIIRCGAWAKGFGVRDQTTGAPVGEDTVFSAQSMSKPSFLRVMKLHEQGVLDLDAPLTDTRRTCSWTIRGPEITARRVLPYVGCRIGEAENPLKIAFQPGRNSVFRRGITICNPS